MGLPFASGTFSVADATLCLRVPAGVEVSGCKLVRSGPKRDLLGTATAFEISAREKRNFAVERSDGKPTAHKGRGNAQEVWL